MGKSRSLVSVGLALIGIGACAAPSSQPGQAREVRESILGGELDTLHDAVVALREVTAGDTLCTGTIIQVDVARGQAAVLTAAHCVATHLPSVILVGPDFDAASVLRYVPADVRVNPLFDGGDDESPYDVGIVRLAGDVSQLHALSVASEGETRPAVGDSVTAFGYGRASVDGSTTDSTKRRAVSLVVAEVSTNDFRFDQHEGTGICMGDSGGPLLLLEPNGEERVVGVHSRLIPSSDSLDPCLGTGVCTRVTGMRDFIAAALAAPAAPACTTCRVASQSEGGSCLALTRACEARPGCAAALPCLTHCTTTICKAQCLQSAPTDEVAALRVIDTCPCNACAGTCPATDVCEPPVETAPPSATASGSTSAPAPASSVSEVPGGGEGCMVSRRDASLRRGRNASPWTDAVGGWLGALGAAWLLRRRTRWLSTRRVRAPHDPK